jgi:cation transport ATPase
MAGGSATSLAAAQVNLLRPGLAELPELLTLARSAVLAAKLNLAWAFLYNGVGLYLAATGALTPIFAASSMVVSSVFSVLNSGRLIRRRAAEPAPVEVRTSSHADSALGPTAGVRSPT